MLRSHGGFWAEVNPFHSHPNLDYINTQALPLSTSFREMGFVAEQMNFGGKNSILM